MFIIAPTPQANSPHHVHNDELSPNNPDTRRCIVSHHRHPPVSPTSCLSQGTRGPLERASMVFQKDTMWWKPGGVDGGKQYTIRRGEGGGCGVGWAFMVARGGMGSCSSKVKEQDAGDHEG